MPIYAASECVEKCRVLRGSDVRDVYVVLEKNDQPSGWVTLEGRNGTESELLRDLGDQNEEYLKAVRKCGGDALACVLTPYTKAAYKERGEI